MSKEFLTSTGKVIEIQAVSLDTINEIGISQRRKAMKGGALVAPPSYTVTTAGGDKQTYQHDEVSIVDATPEEKAAWDKHVESEKALLAAIAAYTMRYALFNGIVDNTIPQPWLNSCEWNGIEVPEDERERRWLYIRTELVPTMKDQTFLFTSILRVSSEGSEELQERVAMLEETFRSSMEKPSTKQRSEETL